MKKKQTKKLVLAKETVRQLTEGILVKVRGGSDGSDGIQCRQSLCLNCLNTQACNTDTTCGTRAC